MENVPPKIPSQSAWDFWFWWRIRDSNSTAPHCGATNSPAGCWFVRGDQLDPRSGRGLLRRAFCMPRTPTSGRCKKAKPPPGENFSPGGGHYVMGVWIIMLYPSCALAADHQHEITVCSFHGGDGSLTKVLIRIHDCTGQLSSTIFLSGKGNLEHFVVLSQLVE